MKDETCAKIEALLQRSTRDKRRAEAQGFVFGKPIAFVVDFDGYGFIVPFTCVCGKREEFKQVLTREEVRYHVDSGFWIAHRLDVARTLRELGSFSRVHLLADGYSEAAVAEIEAKGEAFDRGIPYRPASARINTNGVKELP